MICRLDIPVACVALAVTPVNFLPRTATAAPGAEFPAQAAPTPRHEVERYPKSFPSSRVRGGAARVVVNRPLEQVLRVVSDFERYPTFIRRIEAMEVVEQRDGHQDVAVTVPILNGKSRVKAVLRFLEPQRDGGARVLTGAFQEGNVDRMELVYRLEPIDAHSTRLTVEMLVVPRLPLPGPLVTEEVTGAVAHVVNNLRKQCERLP